ncbi:exodeoxyribonuclease VII large subunit [Thiobacter aerophilum]|uniref:Exodeoxyribonuclease 7 large subunit n=1 Tax=Thiobacter aerophilum TaxID=3121275 RepID=A0ABV0EEV8_9BURK
MLSSPFPPPQDQAIPVSELNRRTRALLENSFPPLWVSGEISNLTRHGSGHWYFSLKDDKAQVRCVMFRHRNQYLDFEVREGMQVEARAIVTLYEPRGDFQLNVETLRPGGLGALYEAFARLKARLEAEGLFVPERKRPLPSFPRAVGIITSREAAALRDVLTTLRRRMPSLPVVIYPTPVQGRGAAARIAEAIGIANQRGECDVLILCRGGGSIEDLWEFNEEIVARAIVASHIPIVCGVGHETDFTIADFAADVRAPTPTAAAELASPNRVELAHKLDRFAARLARDMQRTLETRMQHLDHLAKRLRHPGERLRQQADELAHWRQRLGQAVQGQLARRRWQLAHLAARLAAARPDLARRRQGLDHLGTRLTRATAQSLAHWRQRLASLEAHLGHLNPRAVLNRGYSIVRNEAGEIVTRASQLQMGETVALTFAVGGADARVLDTHAPTPETG